MPSSPSCPSPAHATGLSHPAKTWNKDAETAAKALVFPGNQGLTWWRRWWEARAAQENHSLTRKSATFITHRHIYQRDALGTKSSSRAAAGKWSHLPHLSPRRDPGNLSLCPLCTERDGGPGLQPPSSLPALFCGPEGLATTSKRVVFGPIPAKMFLYPMFKTQTTPKCGSQTQRAQRQVWLHTGEPRFSSEKPKSPPALNYEKAM